MSLDATLASEAGSLTELVQEALDLSWDMSGLERRHQDIISTLEECRARLRAALNCANDIDLAASLVSPAAPEWHYPRVSFYLLDVFCLKSACFNHYEIFSTTLSCVLDALNRPLRRLSP